MKLQKLQGIFLQLLFLTTCTVFSQTVTIDHKTQRFLGDVSELDRSKFFTIHSNTGSDADIQNFLTEYNAYFGRSFWSPFSYAKDKTGEVGVYPAPKTGSSAVRNVSNFIATDHPSQVIRWNLDKEAAANWAVEYWKNFVNDAGRPMYYEPMNEPVVHAGDAVYAEQQPDHVLMRERMMEWFGEIGKKIDQAPELANMKVIGYSSAWPSMELWDFGHWNGRMKKFMDVAGDHMDAFSVHLYDGINVTGQNNLRSGSNSEAILDLIEAYSFIKWGAVKEHAVTEYGGIASGYGTDYSDVRQVQSIKAINHILFNLLERENNMAISIPFITDKSTWHLTADKNYQPYGAALWMPTNLGEPNPAGWSYTSCIYFYELWKNVKGERIDIASTDLDIQIQGFVQGKKLYIALNNLNEATKNVNLDFARGLDGLQSVSTKSLIVFSDQSPSYNENSTATAPGSISLAGGETTVLEYTFANDITFDNAIRNNKYYASTYLQPITAGTPMSFAINGVDTATDGKATLRMSLGRKHDVTKSPIIKINGTAVTVPNNWKGYDQANRSDFFGTLEVTIPTHLIQLNNAITVTFPDNGGRISSMILSLGEYDSTPVAMQAPYFGVAQNIPGVIEMENYDTGGQDVACSDTTTANIGGAYRNDGVDMKTFGTGEHLVGWTAPGEWLEYTVMVANSGTYVADIKYAAGSSAAGKIHLAFDGTNESGSINLPSTGGWSTFETVSKEVVLAEGEHVMRVFIENAGINLDNIGFSFVSSADEMIALSNPPSTLESSNSLTFAVDYNSVLSRDIVVEFWGTTWLGQTRKTVPAGSGTTQVTINLPTAPAMGTGYGVKSSLRPIGGNWTTAISTNNKFNISVIEASAQQPFGGVAAMMPGTLEIENYDTGGAGVAYYDLTSADSGGDGRPGDGVDVRTLAGTSNQIVGWTAVGEWLEYTVNFDNTANYSIKANVTSPYTTAKINVSIDETDVSGDVAVPNTGGWSTYETMDIVEVNVTAGTHVIRMKIANSGFNIDNLVIEEVSTAKVITNDIDEVIADATPLGIYPNPSNTGYIKTNFDSNLGPLTVQIFSMTGNVVREHILYDSSEKVSLDNLSTGVYLAKLIHISGEDHFRLAKN